MTMISYYDFCKLNLFWQDNATAFQAAQLAAHMQHTSEGQEFIRASTCLGGKRGTQQLKGEEWGRAQWE